MPLSKKIKSILSAPFAISVIMNKFAVQGGIGLILFGIGFWQRIIWLKLLGIILAAPIIWVYFILIFVFLPFGIFDYVKSRIGGQ